MLTSDFAQLPPDRSEQLGEQLHDQPTARQVSIIAPELLKKTVSQHVQSKSATLLDEGTAHNHIGNPEQGNIDW